MLANVIFLWKLVPNGIHREASADGPFEERLVG